MLRSRSKLIFPGEEKGEGREGGGDQGERAGRQISRGVAGGEVQPYVHCWPSVLMWRWLSKESMRCTRRDQFPSMQSWRWRQALSYFIISLSSFWRWWPARRSSPLPPPPICWPRGTPGGQNPEAMSEVSCNIFCILQNCKWSHTLRFLYQQSTLLNNIKTDLVK